ncbi:hypothetical protein ACF0H5_014596 [Mactra antiquata]
MSWKSIFRAVIVTGLMTMVNGTNSYVYHSNLQANLSNGYDVDVLPNSTTTVSIQFGMMFINALDTKLEKFQLAAFLVMAWTDQRLSWDPASFGGLQYTKVKLRSIWSPPMIIANSGNGIKFMNDDSDLRSSYVHLMKSGYVCWLVPANIDAQCSTDIQYYPFDIQKCSIMVSSWMFAKYEIDLRSENNAQVNLDIYEENGEWSIISTDIEEKTRVLYGFPMSSVVYTIGLERKYSYYLLNMMLPVVMLTVICPIVFALPVESGEKNGFALTILLSLSVLITVVSDNIPPSSTTVSILSIYLVTVYIMSTVESFITVIVCRLHNKTNKGETPGLKLQRLCRLLATLLCYRCCQPGTTRVRHIQRLNKIAPIHSDPSNVRKTTNVKPVDCEKIKVPIIDYGDDGGDDRKYTYEQLANMIDVLCLYLFCFLTVAMTVVFLNILMTGGR